MLLSQPVDQWTDKNFIYVFVKKSGDDLDMDLTALDKHLRTMGISVAPEGPTA